MRRWRYRALTICPVLPSPRRRATTTTGISTDSLLLKEILPQFRQTFLARGAGGAVWRGEKFMVMMQGGRTRGAMHQLRSGQT